MDPFCYLCFVLVCHTVLSVHCSIVVSCWEGADLMALLHVTSSSVFVTFPYGVLGPEWYLIALIPDLCPLPYILSANKFPFHRFAGYDVQHILSSVLTLEPQHEISNNLTF